MVATFGDRLATRVKRCGNPVVVGLDPRFNSLPSGLQNGIESHNLAAVAETYGQFCREIIDVVADLVPAVKPQAAFFEQAGPSAMAVLANVISYASEKGLLVIVDGKRNDIGSTAQAYADGWLGSEGQSVWGADALTVSPYLGDDSLIPFVEVATQRGAGLFVLVKTSNPGGATFQDLTANDKTIYQHAAAHVEGLAAETRGEGNYGSVGAVVGATWPEQLAELRAAMPHTWFLVPGFGAQGGGAKDVAPAFDSDGLGAVVNSSRGIIFAHASEPYSQKFGDANWQDAVAAATHDMIAQLTDVI